MLRYSVSGFGPQVLPRRPADQTRQETVSVAGSASIRDIRTQGRSAASTFAQAKVTKKAF
jgi:hypothetical protein